MIILAAICVLLAMAVAWLAWRDRSREAATSRAVVELREAVANSDPTSDSHQLDVVVRLAVQQLASGSGRQPALRAALDAIPLGIVACDPEGSVIFTNEAAAEFTGDRHGDALVSSAVTDLLDAGRSGNPQDRTIELYKPPRRTLVLAASAVTAGGDDRGAVVVIEDVTEHRRLEVARRDFVSNISHELKTPVGALALLAETMLAEQDVTVVRRLADRMLTEADRAGRTIDDLLLLSRIESGEAVELGEVCMADVVADAVARIAPAAEQCGITLDVDVAPGVPTVLGDERQLVSAVFNLLDNAVKYSGSSRTVGLSLGARDNDVEVTVTDEGIGIPRKDLDRIFERFYRVDQARSTATGGTGLGLSIVAHIATNHRGEIVASSELDRGSSFTLRLPARSVDHTEEVSS